MFKRGNIDRDDVRQIARETFDRERTQALLEQTAQILHPVRSAQWAPSGTSASIISSIETA